MHADGRPMLTVPADTSGCPIRNVLDHIGDQWSLLVLLALARGPHRFAELQRTIGEISKRLLAQTLRKLERDGFVARKVYPTRPPQVEYRLLLVGQSLVVELQRLVVWAEKNQSAVLKARSNYQAPVRRAAL
jgi:DNA-binding HxlR family transcriptional regulator